MTPLVVDRKAAAAALGVSLWTLDRYIDEGRLPTVQFPGRYEGQQSRRVLIAVSDLEAFVAKYRHQPAGVDQ